MDLFFFFRERFEIIDNLKNKKFNYEAGLWNPDSIFLGGLGILIKTNYKKLISCNIISGKDPLPDKNEDPVFKFKQSLEKSRPKSYKIQFFKGDREEKNDEFEI